MHLQGHPNEAYDDIKKALAAAPAAALAGRELVKLKALSDGMKKGMPPSAVLKAATAQLASKDPDTADEAKFVVESITAWGKKQIKSAQAAKDTKPLQCYTTLQNVIKDFAGTDLEERASQALAELKFDQAFMSEVRAWQALDKIKACEKELKPIRGGIDGPDMTSDKFRKKNAVALNNMIAGIRMMKKTFPDSDATKEAIAIADKYEIMR